MTGLFLFCMLVYLIFLSIYSLYLFSCLLFFGTGIKLFLSTVVIQFPRRWREKAVHTHRRYAHPKDYLVPNRWNLGAVVESKSVPKVWLFTHRTG